MKTLFHVFKYATNVKTVRLFLCYSDVVLLAAVVFFNYPIIIIVIIT